MASNGLAMHLSLCLRSSDALINELKQGLVIRQLFCLRQTPTSNLQVELKPSILYEVTLISHSGTMVAAL